MPSSCPGWMRIITARPSGSECSTTGSRVPFGASISFRSQLSTRGRIVTETPLHSAPVTPVVDRYELGMLATNAYIVRAADGAPEAVVVDPADEADRLRRELDDAGARCAAILVTHCHWDHLLGVADLAESTGAPVYMSAAEAPVLENPDSVYAGRAFPLRAYSPDVRLEGDETLELAGLTFET